MIWTAGTTIIGIPIVILLIIYRGICFGFTIGAISLTLGKISGIFFCLTALFLKNIIFIPAIITLGVSSLKIYKVIIKDKKRENIKKVFIRHLFILLIVIILLILSVLVENSISIPILKKLIKYF